MVDIIVVGGGPAGANFARIAGEKFDVLIIEKTNKTKKSEKCCGGLLNEDSQLYLSKMGLSIPSEIMETPQTSILRAIDLDNDVMKDYRKYYLNISRALFDQWLIKLASERAKVLLDSTFSDAKYNGDGTITVNFSFGGKVYQENCRILVGADGAKSSVRHKMFPDKLPISFYIAQQSYYEKTSDISYMGALFYEDLTDYYSWFIPKSDRLIVGGAFSSSENLKQKEETLKVLLQSRGINMGKLKKRLGCYLLRPLTSKDFLHGAGNIALIGEASGLISPSSSEGISYALRSSYALAKAVIEEGGDYLTAYEDYFKKEKRKISMKKMKGKGLFNPTLRSIAMSFASQVKPLEKL